MSEHADGVIVGSAIVRMVAKYGKDCVGPVCQYIREMKAAILKRKIPLFLPKAL